ncbi:MAG TPA: hypothetical protein VMX18_01450 [Candidatus Bipolaricaulota bacterium]|nr:hypothetical protein [Candidatus Bipolaricaulota bacterium]
MPIIEGQSGSGEGRAVAEQMLEQERIYRRKLQELTDDHDSDLVLEFYDTMVAQVNKMRSKHGQPKLNECLMYHVAIGSTLPREEKDKMFLDLEGDDSFRKMIDDFIASNK